MTVSSRVNEFCGMHAYDSFMDGIEDEFSMGVCELLNTHKKRACNAFIEEYESDKYPPNLMGEILKQLGRNTYKPMHEIIFDLLVDSLKDHDPRMRDAALTGLEMFSDKNAYDYILSASKKENIVMLKHNMQNVLRTWNMEPVKNTSFDGSMYMRLIKQFNWIAPFIPADIFNDFRTIDNTISVFKVYNPVDVYNVLSGFASNKDYPSVIDYSLSEAEAFCDFNIMHVPGDLGTDADKMHYDIHGLTAYDLWTLAELFDSRHYRLHMTDIIKMRE